MGQKKYTCWTYKGRVYPIYRIVGEPFQWRHFRHELAEGASLETEEEPIAFATEEEAWQFIEEQERKEANEGQS